MEKLKDPEHELIRQEIENLKEILNNHVLSRINRIEMWQWGTIALIIAVLIAKLF